MSEKNNKVGKSFEYKRIGRIIAFQGLYAYEFEARGIDDLISFSKDDGYQSDAIGYARTLICGAINNIVMIDRLISSKLKNWDFDRISSIDKAILRMSVYELLFEDVPDVIVINEALEINKQFGNVDSYKFVNGILDAINKSKEPSVKNYKKD